jgi:hypothetical protein
VTEYDPEQRTRTAARVVGPYFVATAGAIFTRLDVLHLLLPAFVSNAPLVLGVGCFTAMAGLTLLALHHHFSSIPAIAITLLAIIMTLRGAAMMIVPDLATSYVGLILGAPLFPLLGAILLLIIGVWLTFVGWFAKGAS